MKLLSSPRVSGRARTATAGFSLVETALALGIISFAFVGLLGLVPIGLNAFAKAMDATVEAQIVQRISTVARQTKFSELAKLDSNPGTENGEELPDFYFDEQGSEVVDPAAISRNRFVYTAAVVLQEKSGIPASGEAEMNPNLATLNIIIRKVAAPRDHRMASVWLANSGS